MFKAMIIVCAFMFCSANAKADPVKLGEVLEKLPAMNQGVAYSIEDNTINYLSTLTLADYKGITFEAGYAGAAENTKHKIVGVISYPILVLKDLGVNLPVVDLIEFNIGVWAGVGQLLTREAEFDYGISATLFKIKW